MSEEDMTAQLGRKLFSGSIEFVRSVVGVEGLPVDNRPEICFVGRSNVGKSSLINAVTGRKSVARTSNTPGRTRELNFFDVGRSFYLVDMPGYGYAKAPKSQIKRWRALSQNYLAGRAQLVRSFLLIDARHGSKLGDHEMMDLFDQAALSYQIVLTKCDKLRSQDMAERIEIETRQLSRRPAAHPDILATSAVSQLGILDLQMAIVQLITARSSDLHPPPTAMCLNG